MHRRSAALRPSPDSPAPAHCPIQPYSFSIYDTTVRVWDDRRENGPAWSRSNVIGAAVDWRRGQALTVSKDGALAFWRLEDGRLLDTPGIHWRASWISDRQLQLLVLSLQLANGVVVRLWESH